MPDARVPRPHRNPFVRFLFTLAGHLSVALGVLGVFVPVILPTTPFLLLAAFFYAMGSPRFHAWLVNHPRLGPFLDRWWRHRAVPLYAKVAAIALIWVSFSFTIVFLVDLWWARAVLVAIGLAVTIFLLSLRTYRPEMEAASAA